MIRRYEPHVYQKIRRNNTMKIDQECLSQIRYDLAYLATKINEHWAGLQGAVQNRDRAEISDRIRWLDMACNRIRGIEMAMQDLGYYVVIPKDEQGNYILPEDENDITINEDVPLTLRPGSSLA